MGKVKPDNCSPIITEDPYQFPMGKVKSLTQLNNKYLDLYQFPMGKLKKINELIEDMM